jgi:hypothetical protein
VQKDILELIFTFTGMMTLLGCATGVIITFIRRRSKQSLPPAEIMARLDQIADRLGRLENAVDSTAVEVERISEAQRFTARVLAERSVTPSLSEKPRGSTTPH